MKFIARKMFKKLSILGINTCFNRARGCQNKIPTNLFNVKTASTCLIIAEFYLFCISYQTF